MYADVSILLKYKEDYIQDVFRAHISHCFLGLLNLVDGVLSLAGINVRGQNEHKQDKPIKVKAAKHAK